MKLKDKFLGLGVVEDTKYLDLYCEIVQKNIGRGVLRWHYLALPRFYRKYPYMAWVDGVFSVPSSRACLEFWRGAFNDFAHPFYGAYLLLGHLSVGRIAGYLWMVR